MFFNFVSFNYSIILLGLGGILYYVSAQLQTETNVENLNWTHRLLINISGYAVIFIPGYLIIKYINKINYIDKSSKYKHQTALNFCINIWDDFLEVVF